MDKGTFKEGRKAGRKKKRKKTNRGGGNKEVRDEDVAVEATRYPHHTSSFRRVTQIYQAFWAVACFLRLGAR